MTTQQFKDKLDLLPNNLTQEQIAKELGISRTLVTYFYKRLGLKRKFKNKKRVYTKVLLKDYNRQNYNKYKDMLKNILSVT